MWLQSNILERYNVFVCDVLEGERLAAEVGGGVGVQDGAAALGGVVTQGDVLPAAEDVALGP